MDIFINDQVVKIKLRTTQIDTMIEEIEDYLLRNGKVIAELKINGKKVMNELEAIDEFQGKIYMIEIQSRTHKEVVIESLYYFDKYVDRFFEILDNAESTMSIQQFHEVIAFIEWCMGVAYTIKDTTTIPYLYENFEKFLVEFKNSTNDAISLFKIGDYGRMIQVIDMEVTVFINYMEDMSKEFLAEIIKEEEIRRFIN